MNNQCPRCYSTSFTLPDIEGIELKHCGFCKDLKLSYTKNLRATIWDKMNNFSGYSLPVSQRRLLPSQP